MYISKVVLKKIRGFNELDITFDPSAKGKNQSRHPRKRTVIIGKNGTCKTTLLRCIALGLSDKRDASGLVSEEIGQLVRLPFKNALIEIHLQRNTIDDPKAVRIDTKLTVKRGQNEITGQITYINGREASEENSYTARKKIFVCGYGVGRSIEGAGSTRDYRIIDSVYSLFNYEQTMIITELALRRLRDYIGTKGYEKSIRGIKRILNLSEKHEIGLPLGGGVTIKVPKFNQEITINAWADGYRLTFQLLLDIYAWAMKANAINRSGLINGIVLIDEIEQHLHPAMQTDLLNQLSKSFPNIQFITTTHSPLVALGVSQSELVVLKREGNQVKEEKDIPNTEGYSAEDVLLDPKLFDVGTVYTPELNKKIKNYRRLASINLSERTSTQKRKLKSIYKELLSQQILEVQQSNMSLQLEKILKKYSK